jgi:putative hydrolase of the HAD superfamily
MALPEPKDTVVVLDLDDTLYKEVDYHASGLVAVSRWIESLYGISVTAGLRELQESGEPDLLAGLCRLAGLPLSVKESLLWAYRLHQPDISLTSQTADLLKNLESKYPVAILTDGRSISQRLKLKALGLSHLPVYISEEHGADKPSPLRFELIMREMPAAHYVYVGDNPKKDFLAPNALGWTTIGLRDDGRNIHRQDLSKLLPNQLPSRWIDSLDEILTSIC